MTSTSELESSYEHILIYSVSLCSMFPSFNGHDESLNPPEDSMQVEDLMGDHEVFPGSSNLSHDNKIMGKAKQPQQQQQNNMLLFANSDNINEASPSGIDIVEMQSKKIVRRDNERQRRQLMAVLNSSLRNLLPHELIKGKRSISEHMKEAVNYINYMKSKIQELNGKREEIRRVYEYGCRSAQNFGQDLLNSIVVCPTCFKGVEVVVSSRYTEEGYFPLSRVLKLLLVEGLGVVECSSTIVNERFFHTIQCEVEDLACVDLSQLQMKLNYSCNSE